MPRNPSRISCLLLTFASIAMFLGCWETSKTGQSKPSARQDGAKSAPAAQPAEQSPQTSQANAGGNTQSGATVKSESETKTASKRNKPPTPPPPLTIPKVGLTDSLRATCLVTVGDLMPNGELASADGNKVALESQLGEKYTVVFFWSEGASNYARLAANAALHDLQTDIAEPYAAKGIKVLGINVSDKPQSVGPELERNGVKIPVYFDPDGAYFSKVAKTLLPRVYLLDSSGKIVWFDTEYSQSTRRNLAMAVKVVLGEK
jgi:peroxiredoxin